VILGVDEIYDMLILCDEFYFLLIGWWLGLCLATMFIPLLFRTGRRFVAAGFVYR